MAQRDAASSQRSLDEVADYYRTHSQRIQESLSITVDAVFGKTLPKDPELAIAQALAKQSMAAAADSSFHSNWSDGDGADDDDDIGTTLVRLGLCLGDHYSLSRASATEISRARSQMETLAMRLRAIEEQKELGLPMRRAGHLLMNLHRMKAGISIFKEKLTDVETFSTRQRPAVAIEEVRACVEDEVDYSFDKAVMALAPYIDGIDVYAQQCRDLVAARGATLPASVPADCACALALYTALWENRPDSFYFKLNALLRSDGDEYDAQRTNAFVPMLLLLTRALERLPPQSTTVWRGVASDLRSDYPKHATCTWWGLSSCTHAMELLEQPQFLGKEGARTLFMITTTTGYDIEPFSLYPRQRELLLPAGLSFTVVGHVDLGHGLHVIQLQQVASPHSLVNTVAAATRAASPVLVTNVARKIGPLPSTRTWRDEWADLNAANVALCGEMPPRDDTISTDHSIERWVERRARSIAWKVEAGWSRAQAQAYTLVTVRGTAALARALREGNSRFAASTHLVCGILSARALQQPEISPVCYFHLHGQHGLATNDPDAWGKLLAPGAAPGLQFVTSAVATAQATADGSHFPDARGFHAYVGGEYVLQESDVVAFRSMSASAHAVHTLVKVNGSVADTFDLPPMATVTLESVTQPGKWSAFGRQNIQRRLFTVTVAYEV